MHFVVDSEALELLHREVFGKRFLTTDRHHWSDTEIVQACGGQVRVEDRFRQIKDDEHFSLRPQ